MVHKRPVLWGSIAALNIWRTSPWRDDRSIFLGIVYQMLLRTQLYIFRIRLKIHAGFGHRI